jgi:putative ABC transport system permease protein
VSDAQGLIGSGIRWKTRLDDEWQSASLIALEDYAAQRFDLITLRSGGWPDLNSLAVEFNHAGPYAVPPVGGTIYVEVNNRPKPFRISGTVRDPGQFPPPFASQATFYATRNMLELLGHGRDFNQVRFNIPDYTEARAKIAADVVEDRLNRLGVTVGWVQVQDPDRHFMQDIMDGVGLILSVMAALSLGLSTILVVNTINALIAQQVPQIGIMKTVGGLTPQIASLYLSGVAVYGLLSLAIAVPLGAFAAQALSRWMLGVLNIPASDFEILPVSMIYQVGTGLMAPLLAALWPVLQGVGISVRQALSAYGVGAGRYGAGWLDQLLGRLQGMPRMAALSLRNTFRRAGRVALTEITLIAAGATFMMVMSAHHSFNQTILQIFRGFGYDVIVGFNQRQRISELVPLVESRPGVERAEMWEFLSAKANVPGAEGPGTVHDVFLRGIPRDTEFFTPELTAGRNLDPADGHALLLNQKLARTMGVEVGDALVIDFGDANDTTWTVVGLIFDLAGRDQNTAYLHRDTLLADLSQVGRSSVVEIRTTDASLAAQQAIEQDMRDFFETQGIGVAYTSSAKEEQEQANAQFSILTTLLLIMTFLIAVVGSFGLSGTLSINVLERRREIGVMRAVGASSADVALIFMGEGLTLGVLSWAQAVPISLLAGRYFVDAIGAAIDFPAVYHPALNGIWLWLGIVLVLSVLASWLPSRRATQISVRESLAYE